MQTFAPFPWLTLKPFLGIEIENTWIQQYVQPYWHHSWQRVANPLFYEGHSILPTPFFNFVHPKHVPPAAKPTPFTSHCVFYATRHKAYWGLIQMTCFFVSTLNWYFTHKCTQHTQGRIDWLIQINIYIIVRKISTPPTFWGNFKNLTYPHL